MVNRSVCVTMTSRCRYRLVCKMAAVRQNAHPLRSVHPFCIAHLFTQNHQNHILHNALQSAKQYTRKVSQVTHFWATVCKNGSPMLLGRCLSVCNGYVGVLWPNGWMNQDGTWHGDRPWSRPHCAVWGSSSPSKKGTEHPQFSAYFYCGKTAGCIKMSLGMEVASLSPGDFVTQPPPQKGAEPPIIGSCLLWPTGWMGQDATWH